MDRTDLVLSMVFLSLQFPGSRHIYKALYQSLYVRLSVYSTGRKSAFSSGYRKSLVQSPSMSNSKVVPPLSDSDIASCIPELSNDKHKGQMGRIAVIGGCREYTGAPYFAASSCLKIGSDLAHVFCTNGASTVIKSYSPELIVHPYLYDEGEEDAFCESNRGNSSRDKVKVRVVSEVTRWLDKFDSIVLGPGLGRDALLLDCMIDIIKYARERNVPMVIDADGLWIINNNLNLMKGYTNAILTPNVVEMRRLADASGIDINSDNVLEKLCVALDGPIIVSKGKEDSITAKLGSSMIVCREQGSPRRAGGQVGTVVFLFDAV